MGIRARGIQSGYRDRYESDRRVDVATLSLGLSSLLCALALWSHHASDPGYFNNFEGRAHNWIGSIGALVSDGLIQTLGVGAFLIPAGGGFAVAALLRNERSARGRTAETLVLLCTLGISVFFFTVAGAIQATWFEWGGSRYLTGGISGEWMARVLLAELNRVGATLMSLGLGAIAFSLASPWSVSRAIGIGLFATARFLVKLLNVTVVGLGFMLHGMYRAWKSHSAVKSQSLTVPALKNRVLQAEEPQGESDEHSDALEVSTEEESPRAESLVEAVEIDLSAVEVQASRKTQRESKKPNLRKGSWKLPPVDLIQRPPKIESSVDQERLVENARILTQKFADFGVDGQVTAIRPGPVITLYEFKPGPGIKLSRIAGLADDLSMALSAQSVRVIAPLPGKSVVGIEIPSDHRQKVMFREFLEARDFGSENFQIPVAMGKDIGGTPVFSDLARMPHLLCAGQTGSGKSVFMNGLICSLLYRFTPEQLRLLLIDPKFIEFRAYQSIPHLLLPVVDDPKMASTALKWAVREMERRYKILAAMGSRNLAAFNQKLSEQDEAVTLDLLTTAHGDQEDWKQAFERDPDSGQPRIRALPTVVIIIDELADLMMIAKKDVEISIARIAQKARAAGIHLVIATQRPSTDVITGLIKANLPSRVSFQLSSQIDSRTILDRTGAERLLGQGDMLFLPPGVSQIQRLHGAFVNDDEIHGIAEFLRNQGEPQYRQEILVDEKSEDEESDDSEDKDELFDQAVEFATRLGSVSASALQRQFKIGYNRAARLVDTMEARGLVGPQDGARPREVIGRL